MGTMKRMFSSPALWVPLITFTVLAALSFWYYDAALRRSESAVDQRTFQALGLFADQFRTRLFSIQRVAERAPEADQVLAVYTDLEKEGCQNEDAPRFKGLTVTAVSSVPEKLFSFTYSKGQLAGKKTPADSRFCFQELASKLLDPFVASFQWDIVKDILLADTDGDVIYQSPRSNVTLTNLREFYTADGAPGPRSDSLERASSSPGQQKEDGKNTASATSPGSDLAGHFGYSGVIRVMLNGQGYRLYTVPVRVWNDIHGEAKPGSIEPAFLVGGIISDSDFYAQARMPLGGSVVAITLLLLLALLAAHPILRYRLLNTAEILRREEGLLFALQMTITATLIAGGFGLLVWGSHDTHDEELVKLGAIVEGKFNNEVSQALNKLAAIERQPNFRPAAGLAQSQLAGVEKTPCEESREDEHGVISKISKLERQPLWRGLIRDALDPSYELIYWIDKNGYQIIRQTRYTRSAVKNIATEPFRFCDSPVLLASAEDSRVQHPLWSLANGTRPFYVSGEYSGSTGRYLIHITRPSESGFKNIAGATIATRFSSIWEPVLLPGFSFAFVDRAGEVVLHSSSKKNKRENVLNACNRNQQLVDFIELRQAGILNVSYAGVESRAFVRPLRSFASCPWSLVVFYDLGESSSDHVKAMTIFGLLLGGYLVLLIAGALLVDFFTIRRPRKYLIPKWLWPQRSNAGCYWHIVAVFIAAFALSVSIARIPATPTQLVVMGFTLPLLCIAAVVLKLNPWTERSEWIIVPVALGIWAVIVYFSQECRSHPFGRLSLGLLWLVLVFSTLSWPMKRVVVGPEPRPGKYTRFAYAFAAWALLFMVGSRPALAFFLAASTFQHDVAARRRELRTAQSYDDWRARCVAEKDEKACVEKGPEAVVFVDKGTELLLAKDGSDTESKGGEPSPVDNLLAGIAFSPPNYDADISGHLAGLANHPASSWHWPAKDENFSSAYIRIEQQEKAGADVAGVSAIPVLRNKETGVLRVLYPRPTLAELSRGKGIWVFVLFLLAGLLAPLFILLSTVNRLFALDLEFESKWDTEDASEAAGRIIFIGLPASGKSKDFRDRRGYVDLVGVGRMEPLPPACPHSETIVLDHFESCCASYHRNRRVLEFIEGLLRAGRQNIQIVSTVDPIYFLKDAKMRAQEPDGNADLADINLDRWTSVLVGFRIVRFTQQIPPASVEESNFYHLLWGTCTGEERLALNQLARHAWPNHAQKEALQHLYQRGLLATGPGISIRDDFEGVKPSFAEYIRSSVPEKARVWWAPGEDVSTWEVLRLIFIVVALVGVVSIILVFGDKTVAYVTTGVTALTTATKVVASAKSRIPSAIKEV